MLEVRTYGLSGMSRPKKVALAVGLVAAGAVALTVGLMLLLGLAVVGTVGAIAVLGYRRLTGRPLIRPPSVFRYGAVRIVEPGETSRQADAAGQRVRPGDEAFLRALPEADRGDGESAPR